MRSIKEILHVRRYAASQVHDDELMLEDDDDPSRPALDLVPDQPPENGQVWMGVSG